MSNRLAKESSPYLLQHKDNPIDWYPWGEEAWSRAVAEDKPVFLSVGYSSCHWCHVMAHESFEDAEVAAVLNREFVSIKLDREERPDVDEVYMTAVQMSNGHGGWPMSLFLTPDKKPFFAGTYFPRDSRGQYPGFLTIAGSLAKAWKDQREDVRRAADEFASALSAALERALPPGAGRMDVALLDHAVEAMHMEFDQEHGGFGGRPKFPPHAALRFLLDYAQARPELPGDAGDLPDRAGHMALFTLEQMALGGIHDQIGGGFHRYSTDERWLLPHFEKMLYDNAQLLGSFDHGSRVAQDEVLRQGFRRVCDRTVDWLRREMSNEDGLLMSALDADSDGREGAYYVWSSDELESALGAGAQEFAEAFQVAGQGNFRDEATGALTGENILHLTVSQGDRFDSQLDVLRGVRAARVRPCTDTKAVAAWNGLAIGALSESGDVGLARACASTWLRLFESGSPHMSTDGQAAGTAFLDDLAFLADGVLSLNDATGEDEWREFADRLVTQAVEGHRDSDGSFFFAPASMETLFGRTKPFLDQATPSPNGVMARVLRRLGRSEEATGVLKAGLGWATRAPRSSETVLREVLWTLWESDGSISEVQLPIGGGRPRVMVMLADSELRVADGGWGETEVEIEVPEGLHINSNEPLANWLVATSVEVSGAYGEAAFPEAKDGVYTGRVTIPVRLKPKAGSAVFELRVRYQACTESECLAPVEETLTGRLTVV